MAASGPRQDGCQRQVGRLEGVAAGNQAGRREGHAAGDQVTRLERVAAGNQAGQLEGIAAGDQVGRLEGVAAGNQAGRLEGIAAGDLNGPASLVEDVVPRWFARLLLLHDLVPLVRLGVAAQLAPPQRMAEPAWAMPAAAELQGAPGLAATLPQHARAHLRGLRIGQWWYSRCDGRGQPAEREPASTPCACKCVRGQKMLLVDGQ
jgi:hypothetical protein